MSKFNIIILFLIGSIYDTLAATCTDNEIEKYLGQCDKNNKRKIFFSNKTNCELDHSKMPYVLENLDCSLKCSEGEYISYDINTKSQTCLKCPANTYSTGSYYRICSMKREWTTERISNFKNNCYIQRFNPDDNLIVGNSYSKNYNQNCTNWSISQDHSNITTGNTNEENVIYVAELIQNINLKNEGSIYFGYKKKSIQDLDSYNGRFQFFIDYEEKVLDKNSSDQLQEFTFNLTAGEHSFVWIYYYYTGEKPDPSMKLELKFILIDGIEPAYECIKCERGFSKVGSDHCSLCEINSYFDESSQECKPCKDGEYSYSGQTKCITKPDCNIYDYELEKGQCVEGKRKVEEKLCSMFCVEKGNIDLQREEKCGTKNYCDSGSYKNEKGNCEFCPTGYYSNSSTLNSNKGNDENTCLECPEGFYAPKVLNITNNFLNNFVDNKCINYINPSVCDVIPGWRVRKDYLIPGNNLPDNIKLILTKIIDIKHDSGYIEIDYEIINLKEEEYFFVEIDGIKTGNNIRLNLI